VLLALGQSEFLLEIVVEYFLLVAEDINGRVLIDKNGFVAYGEPTQSISSPPEYAALT